MLKLFLSDLDGTLLPKRNEQLSDMCQKKLASMVNSGIHFAVVSGRDIAALRRMFEFLPDAYLVGCFGAICVKGDKVLYSRPIAASAVIKCYQSAVKNKQNAVFCSEREWYAIGDSAFLKKAEAQNPEQVVKIRSVSDIKGNIYKVSFYDENGNTGLAETPFDIKIVYDRNGWREYVNRFANKGDAASDIQMRLGIGRASSAAAGNEPSDGELLRRAGYRFSFCDVLAKAENAVRVPTIASLFAELDRI